MSNSILYVDSSWTLFLDRDGVINTRKVGGYIENWDEFEFLPGVLPALAALSNVFNRIVVVTNQQGVGKGIMTHQTLDDIHDRLIRSAKENGGKINKVYACTELAVNNPVCRKPNVGMGIMARRDYPEIDFKKSLLVGDSASDIDFGFRLGMKTCFVGSRDKNITPTPDLYINALYELPTLLAHRVEISNQKAYQV
jgi:D-glycero-D-manno-heptose 1,7-bisphosphate phosphatase